MEDGGFYKLIISIQKVTFRLKELSMIFDKLYIMNVFVDTFSKKSSADQAQLNHLLSTQNELVSEVYQQLNTNTPITHN